MLDPLRAELLRIVEREARALQLDVVLVGALARDSRLEPHGIESGRATQDVDVAVSVPSWESFTRLKEALVAAGQLRPDEKRRQRLRTEGDLWIDLVPCGEIERADRSIAWPPDHDVVMNTTAFREACAAATPLELVPGFEFKVATLPTLAVLKVHAWIDRADARDAHDLGLIMATYLAAGNQERLFAGHFDLLEMDDFDYERAGAQMLGRDARHELGELVAATAGAILALEDAEDLIERIARSQRGRDDAWEWSRGLLEAMRAGLLGR